MIATNHMNTEILEKEKSVKYGKFLEYLTISWNLIEGFVAIASGIVAGSVALVGFGIDSFIEVSSGAILLWRLYSGEKYEQRALQLVGISLLLLAGYVGFEAVRNLVYGQAPEASYVGIIIAVLSLAVMWWLAREKRMVAKEIHSHALEADAKQTDICMYLSAILLGGLGLNALFGWWWADPLAALCMIPIILKEGIGALKGKTCNNCHH